MVFSGIRVQDNVHCTGWYVYTQAAHTAQSLCCHASWRPGRYRTCVRHAGRDGHGTLKRRLTLQLAVPVVGIDPAAR
jgi:hypothetical protein